jgi:hypothetical protein
VGSQWTHLTAQRLTFNEGKFSKIFLSGCLRLFKAQLAGGLIFGKYYVLTLALLRGVPQPNYDSQAKKLIFFLATRSKLVT